MSTGLYIHIPFCAQKCKYCNFQILPLNLMKEKETETIISQYFDALLIEIQQKISDYHHVKTIYLGGGTPSTLGKDRLIRLIDTILDNIDKEYMEEISIEMNPYPTNEMLTLVHTLNKKYIKNYRVRYSFGIQSLDTKILHTTGRSCTFAGVSDFIRQLVPLHHPNNIMNFDFIAFGQSKKNKNDNSKIRNETQRNFFEKFVESGFADSFSIYTLELFEGSERHASLNNPTSKSPFVISDDDIYEEFDILSTTIQQNGYHRYELSNFSKAGRNSIHNRIYRKLDNRLACGTSAVQYLNGVRTTNTSNIFDYIKGNYEDPSKKEILTPTDIIFEKAMLGLRTQEGIIVDQALKMLFVQNRNNLLDQRQEARYITYNNNNLKLTNEGMNVYNSIITELFKEIR